MRRMHRTHRLHYPGASRGRFLALCATPLLVFAAIYILVMLYTPSVSLERLVDWGSILAATLVTSVRIGVAYVVALVIAVPLALFAARSRAFEATLLPVYDVFESIPNLAVYPVLILFFLQLGFLEGAAIAILALNMMWNLVFAIVGGLEIIPKDILNVTRVFHLSEWQRLRRVVMPAIVPQIVTGSILAVGQGWNIIIVAEALHAYLPSGANARDLFGIGSLLVSASARGDSAAYLGAFFVMVTCIALFNIFVWQRLLRYAQRFKFD